MFDYGFHDMRKYLPETMGKEFKIVHFTVSKDEAVLHNMQMAMKRMPSDRVSPGQYVQLKTLRPTFDDILMSDTDMEKYTNRGIINRAHGDVLIGGLGIGLILLPIQEKKEVRSVTVIERESEVIELVCPHLPLNTKVTVVHADVFTWKPERGKRFDTVYMDIWNTIGANNLKDMARLHRRYSHWMNRNNDRTYLDSWRKRDCIRMK